MKNPTPLLLLLLLAITRPVAADSLDDKLVTELPRLGHRNWIVIADAAYPLQNSSGIETVVVPTDTKVVLEKVLAALNRTGHVKPVIYTDKELGFVSEKNAPGIGQYREDLDKLLKGRQRESVLHEEMIAKLDKAGSTFKILLIKTPLTIPYTSVFLELECGYWNAQAEKELREVLGQAAKSK